MMTRRRRGVLRAGPAAAAAFGCCLLVGAAAVADDTKTPAPAAGRAAAKLAAKSVWALVPDAPERKSALRPELIRGAAVAVADGTLLASCGAIGGRRQVGLVRHGKYRRAVVAAADPAGDVCVLRAADAPLSPIAHRRDPASLAVGEPLFAIAGRPDGGLGVVAGRVSATAAAGGDPALAARLALPPTAPSAVVVDAAGALVGLGVTDLAGDGSAMVHPAAAALAAAGSSASLAADRSPPPPATTAGAAPGRPAMPRPLPLSLATSRGSRPVLAAGEPLVLRLTAGADAFAYCFYADADGRVSRIFPNRFAPAARIAAGRELSIPGPEGGFEIAPDRAGTAEEVACFAAASDPAPGLPAALLGRDLEPLPVASLDAVGEAFRAAVAAGRGPSAFGEARLRIEVAGARQQIAAGLDRAPGR